MKAVNLHLLTRIHDHRTISLLLQAMSGREDRKEVSHHEAATLWSLTDRISLYFRDDPADEDADWISLLDGFYFSYVIAHIGKEFDLLKISADGGSILNIELKSEEIEEERIKRQLEQNRYYLTHIANAIYSFTYVMETDRLYSMNDKGFLRECGIEELAAVLMKESFRDYEADGIDRRFSAAEYLISPIASPDKFLQGKYFLTNQQFDFRRRILNNLQEYQEQAPGKNVSAEDVSTEIVSAENMSADNVPVISICGVAGTGKTLLLLDLAMQLSRKQKVLFIHSGPLRQGHLTIDGRLKNVDVMSGEHILSDCRLREYDYLLIDEADHLCGTALEGLLSLARESRIPVILTYDPHLLLSEMEEPEAMDDDADRTIAMIGDLSTLHLSFTGNIRINRPVYSFLRSILYLKNYPGNHDYSCIDVLYANDCAERQQLEAYFLRRGYERLSVRDDTGKEDIIAREYDKTLIVLDRSFYYDETLHLRVRGDDERDSLRMLYESLSRTRDNLCLLIEGNEELFLQILSVRLG